MSPEAKGPPLVPLRALRYDRDRVDLADVIAPPYDVVSEAQREALAARSACSVVRLELPDRPEEAGRLLEEWRRDGILVRDDEPALWWHEQQFAAGDGTERVRSGFMAAVRLSAYEDGRVRPHERTMADTRDERLEVMRAAGANLSPIFVLYEDGDAVRDALRPPPERPPDMGATDPDGTEHRFWAVRDGAAIAAVQEAMAGRELLIADGHHRYETAIAYRDERRAVEGHPDGERPYDFMLMHLTSLDDDGLAVYPTHRVAARAAELTARTLPAFKLRELPLGTTPAELERELDALPQTKVAFAAWRGDGKPPFVATLEDTLAARMAMPGVAASIRKVDAAVLEAMVLTALLGLEASDLAGGDAIRYVRDRDTAAALVDRGEAGLAFLLRAPSLDQIRAVAADGATMPQKSTYFYPKVWSGFLLNPLDDD